MLHCDCDSPLFSSLSFFIPLPVVHPLLCTSSLPVVRPFLCPPPSSSCHPSSPMHPLPPLPHSSLPVIPSILQASVIFFLINHGADMKAVDKDNDNVLHFACMKEFPQGFHNEAVRFLLQFMQMDIDARNRLGDTPLMLAVRYAKLPRTMHNIM